MGHQCLSIWDCLSQSIIQLMIHLVFHWGLGLCSHLPNHINSKQSNPVHQHTSPSTIKTAFLLQSLMIMNVLSDLSLPLPLPAGLSIRVTMITVLRASKVCVWMDNKQYYQPSQYFVCAVHFSVSDMLLMRAVVQLVGGRVKSKY